VPFPPYIPSPSLSGGVFNLNLDQVDVVSATDQPLQNFSLSLAKIEARSFFSVFFFDSLLNNCEFLD
jgi:hypothetical protein